MKKNRNYFDDPEFGKKIENIRDWQCTALDAERLRAQLLALRDTVLSERRTNRHDLYLALNEASTMLLRFVSSANNNARLLCCAYDFPEAVLHATQPAPAATKQEQPPAQPHHLRLVQGGRGNRVAGVV